MADSVQDIDLSTLIIRRSDARRFFYCKDGMQMFAERYALDYERFLVQGITAQELLDTNDALASLVVNDKILRELQK